MSGMTLADFLLARIAEDEAAARIATPGPWAWQPPSDDKWPSGDESLVALDPEERWEPDSYFGGCSEFLREFHGTRESERDGVHLHRTTRGVVSGWGYDASGTHASDEDRAHIARHDPARVLAECEAKRRIVEDFTALHDDYRVTHDPTTEARRLQANVSVAHLATIYADHPDYDPSWRP